MNKFRNTHARFLSTRWSIVLTARDGGDEGVADALEHLCRAYRPPVYAHLRRRGVPPSDAEDVAQAFFAHLLARPFLEKVAPEHGRFRSYLLTALDNFVINQWRHARRQRRAGDADWESLGSEQANEPGPLTEHDSARFDQDWAAAIVRGAFEQLETECARAGKLALLEELRLHLLQDAELAEAPAIAGRLGCTPDAVRQGRSRLRLRLRELLMESIADTVESPSEIQAEALYLLRAWSGSVPA